MKKLMCIVMMLVMLTGGTALAAGLLPQLDDVYGTGMPSLKDVVRHKPEYTETMTDGTSVLIYFDVKDEDYQAYGELLASEGCLLQDYTVVGSQVNCTVTKNGKSFYFAYDTALHTAQFHYPVGTFDEPKRVNEYKIGESIFFGSYEQDGNQENGKEPIEWLVLDYDAANHRVLLLSRYGLDAQPYNTSYTDITWEKCTLRTWLNGTFLNKAFTAQEQTGILLTNVDNSSSQGYSGWSTSGGSNTQDKIFLLSYTEANKYFNVTYSDSNNTKSRVKPTEYAIKQGAYTSSSNKTADGSAAGWWWLRSLGFRQNYAARVNSDGSLRSDRVDNDSACVRPALWINLESDCFEDMPEAKTSTTNDTVETTKPAQNATETSKQDISVGATITFGTYPQTESGTDNTPIEWLVLAREGNKALLISLYGLDAKRYNKAYVDITWEKCTLRGWLNGEFMSSAFSTLEQGAILTTSVDNSKSQGYSGWNTSGGSNTQDKIFLLSYTEANKYMGVTYEDSKNTKSRVSPTAYALKQGAWTSDSYKTADGAAAGWWWLRSPGSYRWIAAIVYNVGSLYYYDVSNVSACVRPALWINLESDIF